YRVESEKFTDSDGEPLSDHFPIMVRFSVTF
ncbi:MAG: endonuclease, partial [Deltaproteobacteria bacterium]